MSSKVAKLKRLMLIVSMLALVAPLSGCFEDGDTGAPGPRGALDQSQVDDMNAQIAALESEIADLQAELADAQDPDVINSLQAQIDARQAEIADLAEQLANAVVPVEACVICHGEDRDKAVAAVHAVTGDVAISAVEFTEEVDGDLAISFNLQLDGANNDDYVVISQIYRHYDGGEGYVSDDIGVDSSISSDGGGNYTVTIAGGATDYAATESRYYVSVATEAGAYADVVGDYPGVSPRADLASSTACQNCHGTNAKGMHNANPFNPQVCVVCHDSGDSIAVMDSKFAYLVHGVHNSHNMTDSMFVWGGTTFEVTYPTYMNNCGVCHDSVDSLATVNETEVSGGLCFSCHESIAGFEFIPELAFHEEYTDATVCIDCHRVADLPDLDEAREFHNGLLTGRSGLIWDGQDQSVVQGAMIDMEITGVSYSDTNMLVTWTATLDAEPVDPCNATASATAPTFHAGTSSNMSILRAYAQGNDWVNADIGTTPGQPVSTNLTTAAGTGNTVCAANVATTTIALTTAELATTATKGQVALQGKPYITYTPSDTVIQVRAKTPTREFVVNDGALPADGDLRRAIVDTTGKCLKCHVGSLYQHGGNRVDNVDLCVMCHNPASSEQNRRLDDGVVATEAYDGKAGQTYEFKSMLHAIHSAGETGAPIVFYRTNGIYAWAGSEDLLPNWPGTGPQTVYGSNIAGTNPDGTTRTHNFNTPTYPRNLNDCGACHIRDTYGLPDQGIAVATTLNAGASPWSNQLDDTLEGPAAAACMSCHQSTNAGEQSALKAHAYQNGWRPTTFDEGRQHLIDAVN